MNTKKGRISPLFAKQGGKLDLALRFVRSLTSLIDLGLNIPIGIATNLGENLANIETIGLKNYLTGIKRLNTKQGKEIVKRYENFVGRSPWDELFDASKDVGDKLMTGLFGLFKDATRRANKIFLLGSLTPEEFSTGVIPNKRLASIKLEMGKYRVIDNIDSVRGVTPEGKLITQYKSWALPIIREVSHNINSLSHLIKEEGFKKSLSSREFHELLRLVTIMGIVGLTAYSLGLTEEPEEDDSFVKIILKKATRDALSLIGALDPKVITSEPRFFSFISDLGEAFSQIIRLEKYKTKEGLKGIEKLKRTITPRAIKQFMEEKKPGVKKLQTLPQLPKLQTLPQLPKLQL